MADETPALTDAAPVANESPPAETPPAAAEQGSPHAPAVAEGPRESATQSVLREAIDKVRAEIAFHESEAQKHLQQAEALRQDLRECYAFLRSGGKEGQAEAAAEPPAVKHADASPPSAPPKALAGSRKRRAGAKKKHPGRRTRQD
jgi:hypothetical protein